MTKHFIVLDTETAPEEHFNKNDMAGTSLVYDFGYCIVNADFEIVKKRSFAIREVFMSDRMKSAYYADKLPKYFKGLANGEWEFATFIEAWNAFNADCVAYNVSTVYAYNAQFDHKVLNHTIETLSNGFCKWFLPYGTKVKDIWSIAGDTICATSKYVKWCVNHGYMTEKNNPSTSAETVYRYIAGNNGFIEAHTALADSEIELAILKKAKKRHQKANTKPNRSGWRKAAAIHQVLKG